LLARPVEDPVEEVEVDEAAEGEDAELLLDDGDVLEEPETFTLVLLLLAKLELDEGLVVDALGLLLDVLLVVAGELLLLLEPELYEPEP
jgi:hypothetical protein